MKIGGSVLSAAGVFCLAFGFLQTDYLQAKDNEMTAEQVVAAHLKSIAPREVLAGAKNRGISGDSLVDFIQGGVGKMPGQGVIVSAGPNLMIRLMYGGVEYPGEYLAYNGKDVTVGTIKPGQRSPLGDFIFRYNQLMKEGLLGGVLSLGWPLYDLEQRKPNLKYGRAKIEGRELHELEYMARKGMNDVKARLYFEADTFRHVRTEYRLKVRGEQGLQDGKTVTVGAATRDQIGTGSSGVTRSAGITDAIADSIYLLVEKFDDFKEVEGMMLPHRYTIEYSHEGQGNSFLANWTIQATQFIHNGQVNQALFKVQ